MATWRIYQCHPSITSSRTWDDDSWHFILLVGREQSIFGFPTGIIEIVSRFDEDECSFAYSATILAYATWAHLWSWLGIGNDFNAGATYQIQVNGETVADPIAQLSIDHGFFVQIIATMSALGDPITLPAERYRRLQGDLCFSLPSGHGKVYKAGSTIHDTELARLPYRDRAAAILNRWPALSVWTMFKTHQTARGRSPPWAAMDDAVIIQENPDGMHVAVLCVVYDGSGPSEYALVLHRHSTAHNLYSILEIATRCMSPFFSCHTFVNLRPVGSINPLNLEEGDFVEVVIVSHDQRQLAAYAIPCADAEAAGSTVTTTCTITSYTSPARRVSNDPQGIDAVMTIDLCKNDPLSKSADLGISLLQIGFPSLLPRAVANVVLIENQSAVIDWGRAFQLGDSQPKQADGMWPHVFDRWCAISHRLAGYDSLVEWSIDRKPIHSNILPVESFCTTDRCRHDIVRRPIIVMSLPLGDSSVLLLAFVVYTWSQNIFRHHVVDSFIPPKWDVDDLSHDSSTNGCTGLRQSFASGTRALSLTTFYEQCLVDDWCSNRTGWKCTILAEAICDIGWLIDCCWNLRPPGNGMEHKTVDLRDHEVLDIRSGLHLDFLDDFIITSRKILIFDFAATGSKLRFDPPFDQNDALALVQAWPHDAFVFDLSCVPDMHQIGQAYLDGAKPFDLESLESFDVFVDGSTAIHEQEMLGSYATLITSSHTDGHESRYSVLGYSGGIITTEPEEISWLGAQVVNSVEAERCGMILAILWCLQCPHTWDHPVQLHFDCTAAGYATSGQWNTSIHSLTSQVARSLGQAAQEVYGNGISFSHVPGHANVPGNEIVDSIAKAIARLRVGCPANLIDSRRVVHTVRDYGSWIWLGFSMLQGGQDVPKVQCGEISVGGSPCVSDLSDIQLDPFCPTAAANSTPLLLNIGTLNVRSLFEQQNDTNATKNTRFSEKGRYLSDQFNWYGYSIIGLQETCVKKQGVSKIGNYLRVIGGANDSGQLGCEIWLHDRLGGRTLTAQSLVCYHSDPRRIFVRLQHVGLDLYLVNLHAPHSGYDDTALESWWKETLRLCSTFHFGSMCVLMDSNAQTSESCPPYMGEFGHGRNGPNTQWLLALCSRFNLWAPNTFGMYHEGDPGTWRHHTGSWHRIDYVLLPLAWGACLTASWTDHVVDLNQPTDDHRPVGCQIALMSQKSTGGPPQYDLPAMKDPHVWEAIDCELRALPALSWDTDVHHHAQWIRDSAHAIMSRHIPKLRSKPRKSFISEETWGLRKHKMDTKKQLVATEHRYSSIWLDWAFRSWRLGQPLRYFYMPHLQWLFNKERSMAVSRMLLHGFTPRIRKNLQKDRQDYLTGLSAECDSLPLHLVYQKMRSVGVGSCFRKKSDRPLPMFRNSDGSPSHSVGEVAECWRVHCANLEAGEVVDDVRLQAWVLGSHHHRQHGDWDFTQIPTLADLERHMRRVKPGKSPGLDAIPSDLLHCFPASMGRVVYPLLLKEFVGLSEPLEHKGGKLIFAYKGRGRRDDTASYRGLMLTSIIGKSIRSAFREYFLPAYRGYLNSTYFSARSAGHVGQACLTLQLFSRYGMNLGESVGILFLDIRSAYYSICRELTSGWTGSDAQIIHALKHFQLPVETLRDIHAFLSQFGGATEQSNLSDVHCSLLTELSTGSWFRISGSNLTTQTHGGSRPGDGLADLIFGYVFGRLMQNFKRQLSDKGLWDSSPWTLPVERHDMLNYGGPMPDVPANIDIIWADDLALAFRNKHASELVDDIKLAAADLFDWCHRFGMTPNTGRGKSEVLLQLRGPHSRNLRLQLYADEEPTLLVQPQSTEAVRLNLVHMYKHLGAHLHIGSKLLHEIRIRSGMMRTAYNLYSRKVFRNPCLELRKRGQLLESMVFSILRWNLGGWYELDDGTYKKYRASILNLIRRTCMVPHGPEQVWKWSDDKVLSLMQIPDPQDMLHLARLSFYTTAFHTGPDELWVLLLAEKSWIRCVHSAIHWMYDQLKGSTNFAGLHDFEEDWVRGVQNRGPKWRGWVKRAKTHSVLQRINRSHVESWHAEFYDKLIDAGLSLPPAEPQLVDDPGEHPHACGPCKQIFRTHTAWATHANRKHNRQDPLRPFLVDGVCRSCRNNYHTTRRLLAHLHYNRVCAANHASLSEARTVGPGRNSKGEDKDRSLPLPVIKPAYPVQFIADEDEDLCFQSKLFRDVDFENKVAAELDCIRWDEDATAMMVEDRMRNLVLNSVVSISDAWSVFVAAHNDLPADDVRSQGLRQVFAQWSLHWLFSGQSVSWPIASYSCTSHTTLKSTALRGSVHCRDDGPTFSVSRPISREVFVIHFFSGVRRQEDIQWWAETEPKPPGVVLTAISIDIIFHAKLGDLSDLQVQQRWLSFLLRACVCAVFIGPPCSTWSVSRWRYYSHDDEGPRPTRSAAEPFGFQSLRLKELRDILLGNVLLLFAFDLLLVQLTLGRICVIEHPAPGKIPNAASIWSLAVFRQIMRFPGVAELFVFQGHYGAISPKPTHFAVSNSPNAQQLLDSCRSVEILPPALVMGKTGEAGSGFNTSQLKEYPGALSRGLALIALDWLHTHFVDHVQETGTMSESDRDLLKPFTVDLTGLFERGSDTRGHRGNM